MNRTIRLLLLLCLWLPLYSAEPEEFVSLRIVEDADGYTNLRAGRSTEATIISKVLSGGVVAIDASSQGPWAEVVSETGSAGKAYLHTSRLRSLKGWKEITSEAADSAKSVTLKSKTLEATVTSTPFQKESFKITQSKNNGVLVNGASPWGTDGEMPQRVLQLTIKHLGKELALPAAVTQNLFQPNLSTLQLLISTDHPDHVLVMMANSDGAGAYTVVWSFQNGVYKGRAVFVPF
jgi:hypothetical protein